MQASDWGLALYSLMSSTVKELSPLHFTVPMHNLVFIPAPIPKMLD